MRNLISESLLDISPGKQVGEKSGWREEKSCRAKQKGEIISIDPKNRGLLKRIHDSAWAWDLFQGPVYNRLIENAAADYFDFLTDLLRAEAPRRLLDVGAGAGAMSLKLAEIYPAAEITGIDYAPQQVRAAQDRAKRAAITNCSFQLGNAMHLPFASESFDLVISSNSLKHWPDPVRGLAEIRRVLHPGAKAFTAEADRGASPAALQIFASKYCRWYLCPPLMRWCLRKVVFGHSYTADEAKRFARRAGFQTIISREVPGPFFLVITVK